MTTAALKSELFDPDICRDLARRPRWSDADGVLPSIQSVTGQTSTTDTRIEYICKLLFANIYTQTLCVCISVVSDILAKNIVSIGGGAENAGVENAGVENAGAITYGKPSEEKTLRYQ